MTPSGIKPATFRFVVQHLNHCATAVSQSVTVHVTNKRHVQSVTAHLAVICTSSLISRFYLLTKSKVLNVPAAHNITVYGITTNWYVQVRGEAPCTTVSACLLDDTHYSALVRPGGKLTMKIRLFISGSMNGRGKVGVSELGDLLPCLESFLLNNIRHRGFVSCKQRDQPSSSTKHGNS